MGSHGHLDLVRAIDVGTLVSHLVVYDRRRKVVTETQGYVKNAELLEYLRLICARELLDQESIPTVIETIEPRGQRLGHDLVQTILWVGRFEEASQGHLLGRTAVYKHLLGKGSGGDDAAIRQVLIDQIGPQRITSETIGPKGGLKKVSRPGPTAAVSGHLWQALGLAVTFAETLRPALEPLAITCSRGCPVGGPCAYWPEECPAAKDPPAQPALTLEETTS